MARKTKVSSQGRTVIPVEIRRKLGIREGEEVEWDLEGDVMVVKLLREEKTPEEIMEYLEDHLVDIEAAGCEVGGTHMKNRMMDEWARRKLGLTQ
ncbi:MAG: AbrB/MazE/SpoVT family DNA-binding domain-containing protein [Thermoproteota archaeon]